MDAIALPPCAILTTAGRPHHLATPFGSLVLDPGLLTHRALSAEHLARAVAEEVGRTRDRVFTPLVTLALFLA